MNILRASKILNNKSSYTSKLTNFIFCYYWGNIFWWVYNKNDVNGKASKKKKKWYIKISQLDTLIRFVWKVTIFLPCNKALK